jgi:hypothetical protein
LGVLVHRQAGGLDVGGCCAFGLGPLRANVT